MDQTCLLHCVLMSVLLISVYGNNTGNTDVIITCPDQHGTAGKSLNLTCNVTWINQNSSDYKTNTLKYNDTPLQNKMMPMNGNHTFFYYTIANASVIDSGVYTLFIQLSKGHNSTNFTVTIGDSQYGTGQTPQATVPVVVVLLACFLITVVIAVFAYKMKRNFVHYNTAVSTNIDDNI